MKQGRAQKPGEHHFRGFDKPQQLVGMTPSILETLLLLNPWNL
jgi:hypothetical protein